MNQQPVVLYVEDDAQSRKLMRLMFKSRVGISQVTILDDSANFEERLAALDPKPTVIFLDIHVTPLDGFEMLRILRTMPWIDGVPIVALTASVMNEEVQRLRTAGFGSCLAKPLDMETFPDVFQRIMAGESIWRIMN
jgi:CheY-like chemotaxis protein